MKYVFWIILREVLPEAHFLDLEANLGETKKIEISYKLYVKHTGSVHVTDRTGGKILV